MSVTYRVEGTDEAGSADLPAAPSIDPAVSERTIETRTTGTVQLFFQGKPIVARANEGVPCSPQIAGPSMLAGAAEGGAWTSPFTWPIVAVHMMLVPDGRVLSIGRVGTPQVWNPADGVFTPVPAPAWLFCSGHTLLSDGRVFLAGGHISDKHGLPNTTLFDPVMNKWSKSAAMARGRWYPTTTTLGNGDVLIVAGQDESAAMVPIPEVWSNGTLRRLTGASQTLPYYPRAFLTPAGTVYLSGPSANTRFLDVGGTGRYRSGPKHLFGSREYGSAVMYDDGKILYAGGNRTTNTVELLDLNQASPVWRYTGSMAFARRHLNVTVLPTGEVLATGGVAGTAFNDVSAGVHAAELWDPASGQWTTLASSAITRGYHATSLLLPDGRVLHAGSGDGAGAPNQKNAEIFSPPYLFRGARPTITSAPTSVRYDAEFRVLTPQAGSITKVSLIRLGSVTHAFDENQRFQRLSFTANATGLTLRAPSSMNRTPPGHYMLFILNGSNVPSVAKIIRIF
ncbi:MAG TPA: galactose oxidase-like domain-containing protein [Gemmatimonadales bacterium]|nr:galactose oxidase-like domain-containing protein [Gemmatimonadales bacterium]